ncbi:MAG: DUF4923 family protein [Rikenellaceae bacterium]|jgi:hypothetical protein|nr:DUF4923 family protein [Rikenellaceae bacterium]
MRRLKLTTILCFAVLLASVWSANAQSLLDLLKASAPPTQEAKPVVEKINKDALIGVWNYSGVAVEFTGTDLVAVLGSSVAAPTIKQNLDTYFAEAGILRGSCSVEFSSKDTYIVLTARGRAVGLYEFNHPSQTMNITYDDPAVGGRSSLVGKLTFAGSRLSLTFEADKIVALIKEATKDRQLDQNIHDLLTLISDYKGLYLGVELEK